MKNDDFDFALWLQEFGHGETNKQLGAQLRELTNACQANRGKGTLVLTIKVGAIDGLAELKASVKATKPMPALPGGSYFVTEQGALVTENPRQVSLPRKVLDIAPVRSNRDKGDPS